MRRRPGFTLIELLIILGMVALLITFLLPAASRARSQSRCVTCMSNLRQLSTAYFAYCDSNEGRLYPCDTDVTQVSLPGAGQAADIPAITAYAGDKRLFHCVEDARDGCRSYSINDYMGGSFPFLGLKHVNELRNVKNSATTFLYIEETPPATLNGFTGGFVVLPYPRDRWADYPAVPHPRGTCLSFVDGHCEFWQWSDIRTTNLSQSKTKFPQTTGNPDLVRLQAAYGQGGVPAQ